MTFTAENRRLRPETPYWAVYVSIDPSPAQILIEALDDDQHGEAADRYRSELIEEGLGRGI